MVVVGLITCERVVVLGKKVPRSSLAEVHREFVHHILEDEVDGQKEGQGDKREDGEEGEESGVVEEENNQTGHTRWHMKHEMEWVRDPKLEPCVCM